MLETRILNREFVVTAEVVPPLSGSPDPLLGQAARLRGRVDAINVTDAAAGKTAPSAFASAAVLAAHGYEPVVQVTCRDRNRIALAADLLGAAAQGVHNVLVLTGDDPAGGDQPDAKPVFDLGSVDVLALARRMRDEGELPSGRRIEPPPHFFLGAADVPEAPGADWTPQPLLEKLEAGARFIQTQLCFDLDVARAYLGRLRDEGVTERLGILIGVAPVPSARSAQWMNDNLYGVSVPPALTARLERARDPAEEGVRICAELIAGLRELPGAAGVHLMAPARGSEAIAAVVAEAGLGARRHRRR